MLDAMDIIQVHQLLGRYGHAIDRRDWEVFATLFVEDATIDYLGGTGRVERAGRDAIVEWFRETNHPSAHHVTNIVVDDSADPDGPVRVTSKFIAPFTRHDHVPRRLYGGDYEDIVLRTTTGWRFSHKQCTPRWQLAVQEERAAPEHRRTY